MYRTNALNTGAGSTITGTATGMAATEPSTDPALCGAAGAGDGLRSRAPNNDTLTLLPANFWKNEAAGTQKTSTKWVETVAGSQHIKHIKHIKRKQHELKRSLGSQHILDCS
jgi:hypothetical protein